MDQSLWALMISAGIFGATMTMTPGPNNILLAQSGANYGVKSTLPHILGIRVGQTTLHVSILLGLGALFESWPVFHQVLKYLSIAYLLFLAYRVATSSVGDKVEDSNARPMTLKEAALFQWVNPKSWMATITLCSAFTLAGEAFWLSAILGVIVFNLVGLPASFTWVFLGAAIRKLLNSAKRRMHFNWLMAALLVASIPMVVN
ncbi:LysE family translocator [Shewanella eurypsychrophilus]|uniref:LysE family translocator n=1 Tax=Shewanella eurypsychrophilus TaxID=2593656 RepID=A0ABX6V798_9GAMM|nr:MULTISPECIES: LysE family translocator [Shewanella]QFU22441.1 LysE family translocator [Shewanella sp. YLB-09]QPG57728.1 LysE family translocator [Shewanella eurypsychrophilus]